VQSLVTVASSPALAVLPKLLIPLPNVCLACPSRPQLTMKRENTFTNMLSFRLRSAIVVRATLIDVCVND
jgi:hypothetical protein